ncbi:hypothetical protein [Microcoleus sp. B13-B6]|uniref:hypothetical protein n=1 Tax=Microcoleus sp. B13-B6 TaxID=2818652 RepID=UPI002FD214B2
MEQAEKPVPKKLIENGAISQLSGSILLKNQVSESQRLDFQLLERCKNSPDRYTIN